MNKCWTCGAEFDSPYIHHYREDMNGEGAYQDFYIPICPCCGSEEIEELPEPDEEDDEEIARLDRMAEERREWEEMHT